MATDPVHRPYKQWVLTPYHDANADVETIPEAASIPFILETLGTYAEIASVGRERFQGGLAQRNALFGHYRNYLRQAMSNFSAAQTVPNRSAGLLYYYSALNFAKAELLNSHANQLVDKRIGHGLSFNPTGARTVLGDQLSVIPGGVFDLLYTRRTGQTMPPRAKVSIRRLLQLVPEISSQVAAFGIGPSTVSGILIMIALDDTRSWLLLAVGNDQEVRADNGSVTSRLFGKNFRKVATPAHWREHFALSNRMSGGFSFYESKETVTRTDNRFVDLRAGLGLLSNLSSLLDLTTSPAWDAWLSPSVYRSRMFPMPPSLARYALTYYASSLVRYKPQMFDARTFPEQAYLFDALSREMALPMLQDFLSALTGPTYFIPDGSLRN